MIRIKSLQSNLCNSSCVLNTEQKDSYHISDEDIWQVTRPRGRWLTYLCGKAKCNVAFRAVKSPQQIWQAENSIFNGTGLTGFTRSICLGIQAKIQVITVYAVDNSPINIYYQLTLKKLCTTKPPHCLQQMSLNDFLVTGHHLALLKCEVSQYKKVLHRKVMQLI